MADVSEFRSALADGDALRVAELWGELFPQMPQPENTDECEVVLHQARTAAESLRLEKRLYSHAWLDERGWPSQLPDDLRPPPQRRGKPVIVSAVGVSVNAMNAGRRDEAKAVEKVMADAAGEMVSCGILDRDRIVARMWEARRAFEAGRRQRMI